MKLSCFIVDYCEMVQSEQGMKLNHSAPVPSVLVEILPYVSNLRVVVHLQDLTVNEPLEIELQLYDDQGQLIAFTEKNRIVAGKTELKTHCTLQTVHCKEGEFSIVLFNHGQPVYKYTYALECEDKNLHFSKLPSLHRS